MAAATGLDLTSIISIVLGFGLAVTTVVTLPLLLTKRMDRLHREDRAADWARQDLVAAKAAEQAELLKENTETMQSQLRGIHTLVNSDMTAAKVDKLTALKGQVASLEEVVALKRALLHEEPSSDTLAVIARLRESIRETEVEISDRVAKTKLIDEQNESDR